MARDLSINCEMCGTTLDLSRAKEAMFERDENSYHVMDLCPECLDGVLQQAESVNDSTGMRQNVAALIRLPGREVPSGTRAGSP